jgi:hypothetical protein
MFPPGVGMYIPDYHRNRYVGRKDVKVEETALYLCQGDECWNFMTRRGRK